MQKRTTKTICLMMLLFNGCIGQFKEKAFVAKYEIEDFSQFKNIDMAFRGTDKYGNFVIYGYAPHLVNDTSKIGYYVVIVDRGNKQIIETEWMTGNNVKGDTIKLQQLIQTFMKYNIPRLQVDEQGNVFVYLKDVERLALVRFVNESELQKNPNKKWRNIKGNWYKPK